RGHLEGEVTVAPPQGADAEVVAGACRQHEERRAGRLEPPGSPPRRQDVDVQYDALLVPIAAGARALYAEDIVARRQGGVSQQPVIAGRVIPVRLEPLQFVPIAISRRVEVTEGGELDGENTLRVSEC